MNTPITDRAERSICTMEGDFNCVPIETARALEQMCGGLAEANAALLERYVGLVVSGDAGNWDAETEPQVINSRAAIAKFQAMKEASQRGPAAL